MSAAIPTQRLTKIKITVSFAFCAFQDPYKRVLRLYKASFEQATRMLACTSDFAHGLIYFGTPYITLGTMRLKQIIICLVDVPPGDTTHLKALSLSSKCQLVYFLTPPRTSNTLLLS